MLKAALACFLMATAAYIMGWTGAGGLSMDMGRVVFVALLVPAVIGVSASVIAGERPDDVL